MRLDRSELGADGSRATVLDQLRREVSGGAVVIDQREGVPLPMAAIADLAGVPLVIVGIGACGERDADVADVVAATEDDADRLVDCVSRHPIASVSLAMLLRGGSGRSVTDGLIAESAAYSMLQAGTEFRTWLATRSPRSLRIDEGEPLRIEREGDVLRLTLQRPRVHNAFNAATRDALLDALLIASADPGLDIVVAGDGPSFCSGGDLDEFGSIDDPASAHLVRVARSVGAVLATVADRTTVVVHGHCIGAGVELPAFAHRVVADPSSRFSLPEVGLGLVPGAGGTVSIPRRIGRHRTNWLALTGETIDAPTALAWGLVDEIAGSA